MPSQVLPACRRRRRPHLRSARRCWSTGCLHEDGLSDVADGFGGGKTREHKLEIMRDSRIGAYGAVALIMSVLIRWSALTQLGNPSGCSAGWSRRMRPRARCCLLSCISCRPPGRTGSRRARARSPRKRLRRPRYRRGGAAGARRVGTGRGSHPPRPLFFGFRALCLRQIGGQTGDTLGALQQARRDHRLLVAAAVLPDSSLKPLTRSRSRFSMPFKSLDELLRGLHSTSGPATRRRPRPPSPARTR